MKAHVIALLLAVFVVDAFAQSEGSTNTTVTLESLPKVITCVLRILPETMREALTDRSAFMENLRECHKNSTGSDLPQTKPSRGGRPLAFIRDMMSSDNTFPSIMICMMTKNGKLETVQGCINSDTE
ncbi:uncharacterized protein LOC125035221 [Penaeus chinensis]|uniref:uncharacterized protein LOC125035221 n=1 Tax=Penaeus chinensis TaxID=139456 RepID=UPI001FB66571|nr:uncharacterized protein LOC125035221 [Penaeus chinensis]